MVVIAAKGEDGCGDFLTHCCECKHEAMVVGSASMKLW